MNSHNKHIINLLPVQENDRKLVGNNQKQYCIAFKVVGN